jgi:hypothetical protein
MIEQTTQRTDKIARKSGSIRERVIEFFLGL